LQEWGRRERERAAAEAALLRACLCRPGRRRDGTEEENVFLHRRPPQSSLNHRLIQNFSSSSNRDCNVQTFSRFPVAFFFCTCVPSGFSGYVCSFRGRRRVLVGTERLVGSCRVVCVLETLTLGVIDCWVLLASCRCHGHAAVRLISHQPTVLFLSEQTSHQYFPLTTNQH
jgi:hypothetical protein